MSPGLRPAGPRRTLLGALVGAVTALVLVACSVLPGSPGGGDDPATPAAAATGRSGTVAPAGPLPTTRVVPFVDLTTPPVPDLAAAADATGQRDVVLAFVLASDRTCAPSWGGTVPMTDPVVTAQIAALKARGGTPTVSSGGALGDYLETRCPDAPSLAGAYARALDAVGTDHLDVDVETDAGRDVPLDRVAQALAQLQRERGTRVTLTVQIEDAATGMTPDALEMVRAATAAGVAARVDLMVMNFGYEGSWADAMTGALDASLRQLAALWPGSTPTEVAARAGVTYMLGRNDTDATTQLPDAAELVEEAARRGVGAVGFWALARDNGGCPGTDTEADDCSGIDQDDWAFTRATQAFARR